MTSCFTIASRTKQNRHDREMGNKTLFPLQSGRAWGTAKTSHEEKTSSMCECPSCDGEAGHISFQASLHEVKARLMVGNAPDSGAKKKADPVGWEGKKKMISHDRAAALQMVSLSIRYHSLVHQMVSSVFAQLPRSRRNHAGAWATGGSYNHLPMGSAICPGTGTTLPSPFEIHDRLLTCR